jgi:hypothetical protein
MFPFRFWRCFASLGFVVLAGLSLATAQTSPTTHDSDILGLSTPLLAAVGKPFAGLSFRGFGGDDKLLYTDVTAGYGICDSCDIEFLGDFSPFGSFGTANTYCPYAAPPSGIYRQPTGVIRYGGLSPPKITA